MKTLFENIRPAICEELEKATSSIYIAVAWFTDYTFFEIVERKAKENVQIRIFLVDDEINFGSYGLDFSKLESYPNVNIHKISETLVHHKFCIIDKKVVLTGSYNWTKKAATKNRENLMITEEYITPYLEEFEFLYQKFVGTTNKNELGINLKIISLQQEIKFLEEIISQLETEKETITQKINQFIHLLHLRLGHLFKKIIEIREKISQEIAQKTDKEEDKQNWKQAKEDKEQFESTFENHKQKEVKNPKKEVFHSLKKLYKEIVKRCHPDKVKPENEKAAEELFKQAQKAFEDGNEELLKEILEKLEKGIAFDYDIESINDIEFLEELLFKLQHRESEILKEIERLQNQSEWKVITTYDDVEVYFSEQEILLNEQIINSFSL
jgi:hypothetical protein